MIDGIDSSIFFEKKYDIIEKKCNRGLGK